MESVADAMVRLGGLALDFGRVERITYHQDGRRPETDTDHTVMLSLIACSVASALFPALDVGKVAQYALVHDVVEVYAGDTPTLRQPTPGDAAAKAAREEAAFHRVAYTIGIELPWLADGIAAYDLLMEPEARFVKALDKMMPKITHMHNGAATIAAQGMSKADLALRLATQVGEIKRYAADFPQLFDLYAVLAARLLDMVDSDAEHE